MSLGEAITLPGLDVQGLMMTSDDVQDLVMMTSGFSFPQHRYFHLEIRPTFQTCRNLAVSCSPIFQISRQQYRIEVSSPLYHITMCHVVLCLQNMAKLRREIYVACFKLEPMFQSLANSHGPMLACFIP